MPKPRCRVDEVLERGGPGVDALLGTGVAAFGAGPHPVAGWWSGGVAGGVAAVLILCCACGWLVRSTDTTVAQWLLAAGIGPLVRGRRWDRPANRNGRVPGDEPPDMRWLDSGTRRDICAALHALGEARGPVLKRRLERRYDERLDSRRFYDRLSALESSGHVARRVDGLEDVYSLTERGERGVREQRAWLAECVEEADENERNGA